MSSGDGCALWRARPRAGERHVARHVAGPRSRGAGARGVRSAVQGAAETEVTRAWTACAGDRDERRSLPAAVWETLPPERQLEVALRLARLLARLVEAARDE